MALHRCSALIFYICLLCLTVGTTLLKPEHCGVVAEFVCPKRRSFLATPRSLSPRATAKGASHHLSSLCWPPSTTRTVLLLSPPLLTTYTSQLHRIPARTRHGDLTRRFASRSVFSCIMEIACVATSFVDGLENSCWRNTERQTKCVSFAVVDVVAYMRPMVRCCFVCCITAC